MNPLQQALRFNALFSGLSGIAAVTFHRSISECFGTNNTTVFWIVGIALLYFAATISYEIFKQRTWAVWWIIVQDSLWVLGSIVFLILDLFGISNLGNGLIAVVASIVLYMAVGQARALAYMKENPKKTKQKHYWSRLFFAMNPNSIGKALFHQYLFGSTGSIGIGKFHQIHSGG